MKQLIPSRWARVVCMPASNMFDTRLSKRTKHRPSNTRTKELCFEFLHIFSNTFLPNLRWSNTIKQHQTRCPNGKMFSHQTMFDGVWSPNISRLFRPWVAKGLYDNFQHDLLNRIRKRALESWIRINVIFALILFFFISIPRHTHSILKVFWIFLSGYVN